MRAYVMRLRATFILLSGVVSLVSFNTCSLLVRFDPEQQTCGENDTCLEGYQCTNRRCKRQIVDAGTIQPDGGSSQARWDEFLWDGKPWQ
jgi:hypothetical protein